jgi:hypothetical protein
MSSVSIAGGAEYLKTLDTTLTLSSIAADEMYITQTPTCASGGSWENYSNSKAFRFNNSNASNSIYVKFRDQAGNESPCVGDTAIHDNQNPTMPSMSINNGDTATASSFVTLQLSASDASPLEIYVTNDPGCTTGGYWESFANTKSWVLGQSESQATVYVQFRDAAFNLSACISDDIVHDSSLIN